MSSDQTAIRCSILRGGSSRGAYFQSDDLPADADTRDRVLLAIMGGPDELQLNGIGGGHPLTNKVAIVNQSTHPGADLDYLFLQVSPREGKVSDLQNCGNILSGVGPYAVASGLLPAIDPQTSVRVHLVNSGGFCELSLPTPNAQLTFAGDTQIDGVPGTGAAIICDFLDTAGSACGALLPTGNVHDKIGGYEVTCIDNGMPVVIVAASAFALSGYESPDELEANADLKDALEALRLAAGQAMTLGDVAAKTIPKMCLVSPPREGGLITTRTFIPHSCHRSIGVFGAISVATGCLLHGSVPAEIADVPPGNEKTVSIEHPAGSMSVRLLVDDGQSPEKTIRRAGVVRTARLISDGQVYVPSEVWDGQSMDSTKQTR
jgi:4-oxalomesaconate tautomerase